MLQIDDSVRARYPWLTDEQISALHRAGEVAEETEDTRATISETDLGLALIARELGWAALMSYLDVSEGSHHLSADDIVCLAHAAHYLRLAENGNLYGALYGSASEVTNRKSVSARKKGLKELTAPMTNYNILRGV